jgi:hypothetical protein
MDLLDQLDLEDSRGKLEKRENLAEKVFVEIKVIPVILRLNLYNIL